MASPGHEENRGDLAGKPISIKTTFGDKGAIIDFFHTPAGSRRIRILHGRPIVKRLALESRGWGKDAAGGSKVRRFKEQIGLMWPQRIASVEELINMQ